MEHLAKIAAVLVIVVILLAGIVTYYAAHVLVRSNTTTAASSQPGGKAATAKSREIIVYTYKGFMAWGSNPNKTLSTVFGGFEKEYNVKVKVVTFDSARQALLAAINEYKKGERTANIVIGVDNLLVYEAKQNGIVQCYYSPIANASVPRSIADALDPDHCVTPFDYSTIAIVYDPARLPENITRILEHPTLEDLAKPEIASRLVLEDPTKSSTGLNFLFWEIAYSEKLEHANWQGWWEQARQYILVEPSWGKAYDVFLAKGSSRAIIVSYGTDPAYSAWSNNGTPTIKASLLYYNGNSTAWLQVEGVLIVKGQPNNDLAEKFVDWLLSSKVQSLIPDNQWMLPARSDIRLPPYYKYALTADNANIIANNLLSTSEIEKGYEQWLLQWTQIMSGK